MIDSPQTATRDPGLAVSLGSSFLGYFVHAGFMAGLEGRDWRAKHIAGCSAGAYIGGMMAGGLAHDEIRERLLSHRLRSRWFELECFLRAIPVSLNLPGWTGPVSGRRVVRYLRDEALRYQNLGEHPELELSIAVTNLTTGRSERVTKGELAKWIVASCAVPCIFSHQVVEGSNFWDGGLADPYPCLHWRDHPEIPHRAHPSHRPPTAGNSAVEHEPVLCADPRSDHSRVAGFARCAAAGNPANASRSWRPSPLDPPSGLEKRGAKRFWEIGHKSAEQWLETNKKDANDCLTPPKKPLAPRKTALK